MSDHMELGRKGEELAAKYLTEKGFRILERNWRRGKNEIDIIARDGRYIVIVEVKTRESNALAEPETAVTREKQKALIRAANSYVMYKNLVDEVRFDIVSIIISKGKELINHIPDAFYPTL
jgi:putative endonuclease